MASEKMQAALTKGEKLIEQGDDADPAEVQKVLRAVYAEDRQGVIDAIRNG